MTKEETIEALKEHKRQIDKNILIQEIQKQ